MYNTKISFKSNEVVFQLQSNKDIILCHHFLFIFNLWYQPNGAMLFKVPLPTLAGRNIWPCSLCATHILKISKTKFVFFDSLEIELSSFCLLHDCFTFMCCTVRYNYSFYFFSHDERNDWMRKKIKERWES